MALLVDDAIWPAHGTRWAHLISDTSVEELQDFAQRVGLPDGAFDADHYDVPAHRVADLVAAGARQSSRREVLAALERSGLRVAAKDRRAGVRAGRRARLSAQWWDLGSSLGVVGGTPDHRRWQRLGEDLLGRWAEPHRVYHSTAHLAAMIDHLHDLNPSPSPAALLATWFHDAVYTGEAGEDEQRSADLAELTLSQTAARPLADQVRALVLMTRHHRPEPSDAEACLVSDADLAVLGGQEREYGRYVDQVRREFASQLTAEQWQRGRAAVLEHLLSYDQLFYTPLGRERFEERARHNMRGELADLQVQLRS